MLLINVTLLAVITLSVPARCDGAKEIMRRCRGEGQVGWRMCRKMLDGGRFCKKVKLSQRKSLPYLEACKMCKCVPLEGTRGHAV